MKCGAGGAPRRSVPPSLTEPVVNLSGRRRTAALAASLLAVAGAVAAAVAPALPAQEAPGPAAPKVPPPTAPVRLTIVHTNDLHAHVENFAAVAAIAKAERARNPNALFLDGGDCITGTAVSTVFQGMPVFDVMNRMGYDAGVLGNHEWDHGWRRVHEFVEKARHPLLCANATDPEGRPFGDGAWKVFEVAGVRIGVIGVVTEHVPTLTTAKASAGCTFEPYLDTARRLVPEVRKQADLVVLLTHCGVEQDAAIGGSVPGIDLIVGGHSHTKLERPLTSPLGTKTVQAWDYGRAVGVVDLTWDPKARKVSEFAARLELVEERNRRGGGAAPRDAEVQREVDAWLAKVADLDVVIGRTEVALSRQQLRPLLERIYRDALGADLGFQNAGGIRDVVKAGDIRITDVVNVLPFDNTLVKIRLRGEQLPEYYRERIGKSFDPAKEYVVATNSYVGDQRQKYFRAAKSPVEDTGRSMRDTVVAWIREYGGFQEKGRPLPEPDERTDPR